MATVEVSAGTPHILQGSGVTVTATFYSDGTATDPGATTVAVTNLAGDTVVASGAAGGTGTSRTVTLDSDDTADLDTLTVTWTTTNLGTVTTTHEVVGAFLFTVAEARAFDSNALSSVSKYTTAAIEEARARILNEFEEITGVAFVPRYRRAVYSGTGAATLFLDRMFVTSLRSVETRSEATWTAYTADDLADVMIEPWGHLTRDLRGTFITGHRNVRVGFEHGYDAPPLDIKRAALIVCRYELVEQNVTDRTLSLSTEFGTTQLSTPNPERHRWYGIPRVDTVLANHLRKTPVIA